MARKGRKPTTKGYDPLAPKRPVRGVAALKGAFVRNVCSGSHNRQILKVLTGAEPGEIVRVNGECVARINLGDDQIRWHSFGEALLKEAERLARGKAPGEKFTVVKEFLDGIQKTTFVAVSDPLERLRQDRFPFRLDIESALQKEKEE